MAVKTEVLLRILKSASIQEVQLRLIGIANQWAAAGCLQEANRLLSVAREAGDLSTFTIPLAAFEIPWSLTRTRPTNWPPSAQDIDAIEFDLWTRLFGSKWPDAAVNHAKNTEPEELGGKSLLIRAVITAYDDSRSDRIGAPEMLAEAAELLDRFLGSNTPDAVGYTLFHALTCRAIVAARLGDLECAKETLVTWGKCYNTYPENWIVWYPLMDRAVATILLSGILASVWQITPQQCDEDAATIEGAMRERMATGRQLAYRNLPWTQLLTQLSDAAPEGDHQAQNLRRAPATASAIEASEARLGLSLPESYRGFLGASNGFGMYSITGIEILPIERTCWLREAMPDLIYSYHQLDEQRGLTNKLRESLLIGRDPSDEQQLLLVPADNPATEWECWFFAHWVPGEVRHPTFRYYIESEVHRLNENRLR
jgi:SMI1 / KNR4 family (SUKH-1)